MRYLLLCLFLSACTHDPARNGIWIVKPTPIVRCEATEQGTVCRSVRAIPAEEVGI